MGGIFPPLASLLRGIRESSVVSAKFYPSCAGLGVIVVETPQMLALPQSVASIIIPTNRSRTRRRAGASKHPPAVVVVTLRPICPDGTLLLGVVCWSP